MYICNDLPYLQGMEGHSGRMLESVFGLTIEMTNISKLRGI